MGSRASAPAARKSILKLQLEPSVSLDLKAEAKRRGVDYESFVATILGAVASHELYAAVLDI